MERAEMKTRLARACACYSANAHAKTHAAATALSKFTALRCTVSKTGLPYPRTRRRGSCSGSDPAYPRLSDVPGALRH
jgi:hypothetical protein